MGKINASDSGWTFDTSAGGTVGASIFQFNKGHFIFKDPHKAPARFNYISGGAGYSYGPEELGGKGGTGSTEGMYSKGAIYKTRPGPELTKEDFAGFFCYTELSFTPPALSKAGISGSVDCTCSAFRTNEGRSNS
jgi:hypothetical protein